MPASPAPGGPRCRRPRTSWNDGRRARPALPMPLRVTPRRVGPRKANLRQRDFRSASHIRYLSPRRQKNELGANRRLRALRCRVWRQPPPAVRQTLTVPQAGQPGAGADVPSTGTLTLSVGGSTNAESLLIQVPEYDEDSVGITIDGQLDERVWQEVPNYDGMKVIDPDLLTNPRFSTRVSYLYTSKGLYVAARNGTATGHTHCPLVQ